MIPYFGLPINPSTVAVHAIGGAHAFVSFSDTVQLKIAVEICQSFAIDNGAFSAWRAGRPVKDWSGYYGWATECKAIPSCDFAVIPDVIDGSAADNDALLAEWPLPRWFGAPVWHMHEPLERLERLATDWPRVCLGSSGEFSTVGTAQWWSRMGQAMRAICDDDGRPITRLHGLRMLDPAVFTRLPLASADSTNLARNVGIDSAWKGTYSPLTKESRATILRHRCEAFNSPPVWGFQQVEQGFLW